MDNYKITQNEINDNNVKSAADLLKGEPRDNKNIFDRLPELIAGKMNGFIDAVISKFTDYYNKTEVDGKENVLNEAINTKANADDVYTKEQTYTKSETDEAISRKVLDIGAGDMAQAVYDTDFDGVVDKAETAENAENAETSQNVRGYWLSKTDANGNPTDELYAHWYEDSETGEVVGGGEALSVADYELIETITLTEDTTVFRNKTPNGEDYAFKKLAIYIEVPANTTTSYVNALIYRGNEFNVIFTSWKTIDRTSKGLLIAERIGSRDFLSAPSNMSDGLQSRHDCNSQYVNPTSDYYTQLAINVPLPEGTIIEIIGVKA